MVRHEQARAAGLTCHATAPKRVRAGLRAHDDVLLAQRKVRTRRCRILRTHRLVGHVLALLGLLPRHAFVCHRRRRPLLRRDVAELAAVAVVLRAGMLAGPTLVSDLEFRGRLVN